MNYETNLGMQIATGYAGGYSGAGSSIGLMMRHNHERTMDRIRNRSRGYAGVDEEIAPPYSTRGNSIDTSGPAARSEVFGTQVFPKDGIHIFTPKPGKTGSLIHENRSSEHNEEHASDLSNGEGGYTPYWLVGPNAPVTQDIEGTFSTPIWKDKDGHIEWAPEEIKKRRI